MSLTVAHALPSHYPRCSEDSQQTGSVSDASVKSKPDFNLEEDCDVFDVVLVPGKITELAYRKRTTGVSSARPIYKATKRTIGGLFGALSGRKNMSLVVWRNEGLSAVSRPTRGRMRSDEVTGGMAGGKGYTSIFESYDTNPRAVTMTPAEGSVLWGIGPKARSDGGACRILMSPTCGTYDSQRITGRRQGRGYHFFDLMISSLSSTHYSGGGYFVVVASSAPGVVCELWCTRYEKRHWVKIGDDILVAELRVPSTSLGHGRSSWSRLLRDHNASLHVFRESIDLCFAGANVSLIVDSAPSPPISTLRHCMTREQGVEVVVACLSLSVLIVEHEGLVGSKWGWLGEVSKGEMRRKESIMGNEIGSIRGNADMARIATTRSLRNDAGSMYRESFVSDGRQTPEAV